MKPAGIAAVAAVVLVVALLAYGVASSGEGSLALGDRAPVRKLSVLGGGGSASLAGERGKWVFVNVWASWCEPCRRESPTLQRFHDRHRRDGFTVLGIDTEDLTGDALKFVHEYRLRYPQLRDAEGDTRKDWGMTGFPESFLVDPAGRVRLIRRGPVTAAYLDANVAPMIGGHS